MRRLAYAGAVLALSGLLAACGTTAEDSPAEPPRQTSLAEQQQAVGAPVEQGYRLRIDKIGVNTELVRLGLNADGTLAVPPLSAVQTAGYYDGGPKPGQVGPSVVLGHVNGGGQQGVFANLADLREGDTVETDTPQGVVKFEVYKVRVIAKDRFPTAEVYGDRADPELVLVTCGPGAMDSAGANYLNQTLAFARKVS